MPAPGAGLSGILVVDKPIGPTSHDVVALVRRLAGTRRIGHGGTLDPFARGVLPLFIGAATRIAEYHAGDPKRYRATVVFGARSSTDDMEGELTPGDATAPDQARLEAALPAFRGEIRQRPPAYSAIKVAGRRAYRAARAGTPLELPERDVTITSLELVGWDAGDPERPAAELEIACSAGTYVRALARDLGDAVGSGAYLAALTRSASGPFTLEDALELDDVRRLAADDELASALLPMDHGLERFARVGLAADEVKAIERGQVIRVAGRLPEGGEVRLVDPKGRLVAIARVADGRVHPDKVFATGERV